MTRVLVFGDSIAYGAWDREGGWVARLRKFLDGKTLSSSGHYFIVYNVSISGDGTEDVLERFEFETKQRAKEDEDDTIILFAVGGNDASFVNEKKEYLVSSDECEKNIKKLISKAKEFSSKIVFLETIPVDDAKTDPLPWAPKVSNKFEDMKKYNSIIRSVCEKKKIHYIEVFDEFVKDDYKKLLEDGVHPNTKGHEKIFEIVKNYLIKNGILEV